ncbi:hypothetical protein G6O69_14980 [Pseudenhygromyxa sp. WMMC2535]|uniref:hypothetical protein n=1 Tax=Pseudenhygromyxa sp. WMMC2535 TaxID=2712867 RepID=UPI001555ECD2|nr:hypothetical protein [Pseudenhygromyxa sp. WMMC2535]NVB39146.1 hypothetical protein [Pseudenhygromyxa sp. WMMC2535]
MAQLSEAEIKAQAEKIMAQFDDGWQWTDLFVIVPTVMELVEDATQMNGAEKQAAVEGVCDYVIDNTDIPWLPDNLIDPILKEGVRKLIPVIVDATKGKFGVNKSVNAGRAVAGAALEAAGSSEG